MSLEHTIRQKLSNAFSPQQLVVQNESHMHAVAPGSETHFRVLVVSEKFADMTRIARHRAVHEVLAQELAGGVHALAIDAKTPAQMATGESPQTSPECRGGSRLDLDR